MSRRRNKGPFDAGVLPAPHVPIFHHSADNDDQWHNLYLRRFGACAYPPAATNTQPSVGQIAPGLEDAINSDTDNEEPMPLDILSSSGLVVAIDSHNVATAEALGGETLDASGLPTDSYARPEALRRLTAPTWRAFFELRRTHENLPFDRFFADAAFHGAQLSALVKAVTEQYVHDRFVASVDAAATEMAHIVTTSPKVLALVALVAHCTVVSGPGTRGSRVGRTAGGGGNNIPTAAALAATKIMARAGQSLRRKGQSIQLAPIETVSSQDVSAVDAPPISTDALVDLINIEVESDGDGDSGRLSASLGSLRMRRGSSRSGSGREDRKKSLFNVAPMHMGSGNRPHHLRALVAEHEGPTTADGVLKQALERRAVHRAHHRFTAAIDDMLIFLEGRTSRTVELCAAVMHRALQRVPTLTEREYTTFFTMYPAPPAFVCADGHEADPPPPPNVPAFDELHPLLAPLQIFESYADLHCGAALEELLLPVFEMLDDKECTLYIKDVTRSDLGPPKDPADTAGRGMSESVRRSATARASTSANVPPNLPRTTSGSATSRLRATARAVATSLAMRRASAINHQHDTERATLAATQTAIDLVASRLVRGADSSGDPLDAATWLPPGVQYLASVLAAHVSQRGIQLLSESNMKGRRGKSSGGDAGPSSPSRASPRGQKPAGDDANDDGGLWPDVSFSLFKTSAEYGRTPNPLLQGILSARVQRFLFIERMLVQVLQDPRKYGLLPRRLAALAPTHPGLRHLLRNCRALAYYLHSVSANDRIGQLFLVEVDETPPEARPEAAEAGPILDSVKGLVPSRRTPRKDTQLRAEDGLLFGRMPTDVSIPSGYEIVRDSGPGGEGGATFDASFVSMFTQPQQSLANITATTASFGSMPGGGKPPTDTSDRSALAPWMRAVLGRAESLDRRSPAFLGVLLQVFALSGARHLFELRREAARSRTPTSSLRHGATTASAAGSASHFASPPGSVLLPTNPAASGRAWMQAALLSRSSKAKNAVATARTPRSSNSDPHAARIECTVTEFCFDDAVVVAAVDALVPIVVGQSDAFLHHLRTTLEDVVPRRVPLPRDAADSGSGHPAGSPTWHAASLAGSPRVTPHLSNRHGGHHRSRSPGASASGARPGEELSPRKVSFMGAPTGAGGSRSADVSAHGAASSNEVPTWLDSSATFLTSLVALRDYTAGAVPAAQGGAASPGSPASPRNATAQLSPRNRRGTAAEEHEPLHDFYIARIDALLRRAAAVMQEAGSTAQRAFEEKRVQRLMDAGAIPRPPQAQVVKQGRRRTVKK